MLTIAVEFDNRVVFLIPFIDHKEAIDTYVTMLMDGQAYHGASINLTSRTEIELGEPMPDEVLEDEEELLKFNPFYVS